MDRSRLEAGKKDVGAKDGVTHSDGNSVSVADKSYVMSSPYVCSDIFKVTSKQVRGLKNGTNYNFYVVSIDTYNNPSSLVYLGQATPTKEEDLWERYKRSGGQSNGGSGCCFVATVTHGSHDHLFLGALALGAGLMARRRLRARRQKGARP